MKIKSGASKHVFTDTITAILQSRFGVYADDIFKASPLLGYLNIKTRAANRGSKSRSSFANLYALYVVIEDYIGKGFFSGKVDAPYAKYDGARFTDLLLRAKELPFGSKLQNHALNGRLNDEFRKYYQTLDIEPIVRNEQRYWIHEDLLNVTVRHKDGSDHTYNIAEAVIDIIDAYIKARQAAFDKFYDACRQIAKLEKERPEQAEEFVKQQLQPNVDARIFEIVSFSVLKAKYGRDTVWLGDTKDTVKEEGLILYKTGRTNANDGGIDFVMRPLGRFFQVTETIEVNKYFLDIDKVLRFPITFVVKSKEPVEKIKEAIREQASAKYKIESVVESYMKAIEEIINVDCLLAYLGEILKAGQLQYVMNEIVTQSKVEFNYSDEENDL